MPLYAGEQVSVIIIKLTVPPCAAAENRGGRGWRTTATVPRGRRRKYGDHSLRPQQRLFVSSHPLVKVTVLRGCR